MMYYGSDQVVTPPNYLPISLSRSGIPRIIPSHHRRMICVRDQKADMLVKWYLSIFSFSKIITLAKRVENTFPVYLSRCLVWTLLLSWLAP